MFRFASFDCLRGCHARWSDVNRATLIWSWFVKTTKENILEMGGRIYAGTPDEVVSQQAIFTRKGTDRIMRYAFDLAMKRERKNLTSATKSNGIIHSMPFWDERLEAISAEYPDVETSKFHIDILTARFVTNPDWFDVVVIKLVW